MNLPPPKFIPDVELERHALDLLDEHEAKWQKRISLPVPIEAIIERTLGLRLIWLPIEEDVNELILARIVPDFLDFPTIQLNENRTDHFHRYFGTEQFSLAHEVAHWILHFERGANCQIKSFANSDDHSCISEHFNESPHSSRREIQANRFAAYLLLPKHLLRPYILSNDLSMEGSVAALGRRCGVSKRAMEIRLEQLGFIHLEPHSFHQDQADLNG